MDARATLRSGVSAERRQSCWNECGALTRRRYAEAPPVFFGAICPGLCPNAPSAEGKSFSNCNAVMEDQRWENNRRQNYP